MTSTAIPTDSFTQRLQQIGQWITRGELPRAAKALNAAAKISPKDPRIYLQGARLAEAAGNAKGAQESARRAVSLNPEWSVAVTELAALLSRQNEVKESIEVAQKALSLDPDNPEVLARVVDVAHRAQNFELSLQCLRRLSELQGASKQISSLIARDLRLLGHNDQALAVYEAMLVNNPDDVDPLLGRAQVSWMLGQQAVALKDCEALLAIDPTNEVFRFWHTLASGDTPATMPLSMVRELHDADAAGYEHHMVQGLQYQLPRLMAGLIRGLQADTAFNLLDLGCGTGLLGASLGKLQGAMVGVDVSLAMVEQAARHNVYDRFHTVNLLDALAATPDALYHVISACVVFNYVGDLSQAIPNAWRVLLPGGHLVFSCEAADEAGPDLVLLPNLRFAHKRSAIEALCRAAGFDTVEVTDTALFMERHQPVPGFVVVAHKPA